MKRSTTSLLLLTMLFGLTLLYSGCEEQITGNKVQNLAPDTRVAIFAVGDISKQPSKLQVNWWGDDKDGLIVGYFFSWNNKDWGFTSKNDSLFSLQIGSSDTTFSFQVAAADNGGNNVYDATLNWNGVNLGGEPYTDVNGNGKYDLGEPFTDIGIIDPSPATQKFPIKNSAPTLQADTLAVIPAVTLPVITLSWNASDIDGDATISYINIVVNDTNNVANTVQLSGDTRLIALRVNRDQLSSANPLTEILINGQENLVFSKKLPGIKLNDTNRVYVQAVDISGAKTPYASFPREGKTWFVQKPKGDLLIVDDYTLTDNSASFTSARFDAVDGGKLAGKYDIFDIDANQSLYFSFNFNLTMKLYKYVYWYSDADPSLAVAADVTSKYLTSGGKICFSLLPQATFEITTLQDIIPIDSVSATIRFLSINVDIKAESSSPDAVKYPTLKTTNSIFTVRGYYPSAGAIPVYVPATGSPKGNLGLMNSKKTLFYLGVPLNQLGDNTAVTNFLKTVLVDEFGMSL